MRAGSGSSQAGRNRVRVPSAGSAAATPALRVGTPAALAPLIAHALLDSVRRGAPGHEGGTGPRGGRGEARDPSPFLAPASAPAAGHSWPTPSRCAPYDAAAVCRAGPAGPAAARRVECEYTHAPRVSVCHSVMLTGTSQAAW
jgi:hypothetical protein